MALVLRRRGMSAIKYCDRRAGKQKPKAGPKVPYSRFAIDPFTNLLPHLARGGKPVATGALKQFFMRFSGVAVN